MKLLWCTDVHFDHLPKRGAKAFGVSVAAEHPDAQHLVISGDIGTASCTLPLLTEFVEGCQKEVSFVLGNHDFFNSSIAKMQKKCAKFKAATWLSDFRKPTTRLTELSCLVGQDGWYDARVGNIYGLWMSDFQLIEDFKTPHGDFMWGRQSPLVYANIAQSIARRETALAEDKLRAAIGEGYKHIYFATHFPPFPEATWHQGKMSSYVFLPWFCSVTMGEMLSSLAEGSPDVLFTVLCGHTHGAGVYQPLPNLVVHTGTSGEQDYGTPCVAGVFNIP